MVWVLRELTTRERCQIEGSGKHSPLFNHNVKEEREQPSTPPQWLPPQLSSQMPLTLCWQPFYWVRENLSPHTSSLVGLPPDTSVRIRPCAFMMGPSDSSKLSSKVPTSACKEPELSWRAKESFHREPYSLYTGLPMGLEELPQGRGSLLLPHGSCMHLGMAGTCEAVSGMEAVRGQGR